MPDISVSRSHALIKCTPKGFFLEDALSKFGTLIQINSEVMLLPNRNLALQLGKSFTTFRVEKTCLGMLKCYRNPHSKLRDYNDYFNEKWKYIKDIVYKCDEINDSQIFSDAQSEKDKRQKEDPLDNPNIKTIDYNDYCPDTGKQIEERKETHQILFGNNQQSPMHNFKPNNDYEMLVLNSDGGDAKKCEEREDNHPQSHKRTSSRNNFLPEINVENSPSKKKSIKIPKPLSINKSHTKHFLSTNNQLKDFRGIGEDITIPVSARKDSFRSSEVVINSIFDSGEKRLVEKPKEKASIKKMPTENVKLELTKMDTPNEKIRKSATNVAENLMQKKLSFVANEKF